MRTVTFEASGYVKSSFSEVILLHVGLPVSVHSAALGPIGTVMLFHCPIRALSDTAEVKSYS